jgi:hypothetical protein
VQKLLSWLEERGGEATAREIQRAHVAGARTAVQAKHLLVAYEGTFPGCVTEEAGHHGGRATVIVRTPIRTPFTPNVATGDNGKGAGKNPRSRAKNPNVATGDNGSGDNGGDNGKGADIGADIGAQGSFDEGGAGRGER